MMASENASRMKESRVDRLTPRALTNRAPRLASTSRLYEGAPGWQLEPQPDKGVIREERGASAHADAIPV